MKNSRLLKIALIVLLVLFIGGLALLGLAARAPASQLNLKQMTNTVNGPLGVHQHRWNGPVATFEKQINPSRILVRRFANSSRTRIFVLRHGQWTELTPSEIQQRVVFSNALFQDGPQGRVAMQIGYTFEIKVPVCQKWKAEFEVAESHRIGSRLFHVTFTRTNTWTSEELPGWSEIRKSFNPVEPPPKEP